MSTVKRPKLLFICIMITAYSYLQKHSKGAQLPKTGEALRQKTCHRCPQCPPFFYTEQKLMPICPPR